MAVISTSSGEGWVVHKVWRDQAIDIWKGIDAWKDAVFYTCGTPPLQRWCWPKSEIEVIT